MTARTHDLAAIMAFGGLMLVYQDHAVGLASVLVGLLANQIGGIAPDIDQPTAPLWRNLPLTKSLGKIFGNFIGGHRFLTHSFVGLFLAGIIANLFLGFIKPILGSVDQVFVWRSFMLGLFSHLLVDTFTKEGVPWFLPIPVRIGLPPFKKLRMTTGKFGEKFFFTVLLLFDMAIVWQNFETVKQIARKVLLKK